MSSIRRFVRPALVAAVAAATAAVTSVVAVTVAATPSRAQTCAGYVALTFDDGPTPGNTQNLLNALRSAGLRATMFNEGAKAQANPSLVQAQVAAGMWVGNHSWDHPHMTQLSTAQMTSQISQTQQAIQQATGTAPRLFRPPYGETNATLRSVESQFGLTEILWDVDSQDWNNASTASIVQAVGRLTNGQNILMHDWPANTVAAIPQIATNLRSRNLCAGMISPTTGRAVAPGGGNPTQPTSTPTGPTGGPTSSPTGGPTSSPPPGTGGACQVRSAVNSWNNGLTNSVTISNASGAAVSNWRLTFTLPAGQTITSGWNATYSPASGQVTATNAGYNATIAPNASVGIGYQATHNGNTAAPAGFALNGVACTAG
jgi:peptidoglycan-N-acetylglucosamine deacetylase